MQILSKSFRFIHQLNWKVLSHFLLKQSSLAGLKEPFYVLGMATFKFSKLLRFEI